MARDGFISVDIGPKLMRTYIHKALLALHSEYFANAMKKPWKEATEGNIVLADVEPAIFDIFANWIYTSTILSHVVWTEINKEAGAICDEVDDDPYVTTLVKAYVFGDRFLAPTFRKAVLDFLIEHVSYFPIPPWFYATAYGFDNLPEEDPMLQALVDIHCCYYKSTLRDAEEEAHLHAPVSVNFWTRTTFRYSAKVRTDDVAGSSATWILVTTTVTALQKSGRNVPERSEPGRP
jgi:hypothetical protein